MARVLQQVVVALMWLIVGRIEAELDNDHPLLLVEHIRRQLMHDNYDYMPPESDEKFPTREAKHELGNEDTSVKTTTDYDDINSSNDLDARINNTIISETNRDNENEMREYLDSNIDARINNTIISETNRDNENEMREYLDSNIDARNNNTIISETNRDNENEMRDYLDSDGNLNPRRRNLEPYVIIENDNMNAISKKDLPYYIDNDTLKHNAAENAVDKVSGDIAKTITDTTTTTIPKVKYKVLKVKQPHANRRSQTLRRFIQEEGDDGVVIINLDDEPFPEFRLPKTRRQYMMDQDDFDSGMEIAPLTQREEE